MENRLPSAAIVGLHTCDNLAARILKLYARSPSCQVVCVVGCCYHLLEEESSRNPYLNPGEHPQEWFGFPISKFLRDRSFALGRHARTLACEALAHILANKTILLPVLFYRSLQQVILRDRWGAQFDYVNVGRSADPHCTFVEHVQKALCKLGLSGTMSEEEIEQNRTNYLDFKSRFTAFCKIRNLISPAIESFILLDRLCFKCEQESVKCDYLVRIFDPVISPRCYAIVATK